MSHVGHFLERCEHGVVVAQCRCMSPDRTVTIVACPPGCLKKYEMEQRPKPDDLDGHIAMVKKNAESELTRQLERINYGLIAGIAAMFVLQGIVEVWRG